MTEFQWLGHKFRLKRYFGDWDVEWLFPGDAINPMTSLGRVLYGVEEIIHWQRLFELPSRKDRGPGVGRAKAQLKKFVRAHDLLGEFLRV